MSSFTWADNPTAEVKEFADANSTKETHLKRNINDIVTKLNSAQTQVNVSPEIMEVLNKTFSTAKVSDGFRIQIYSSNRGPVAKQKAFEIEKEIKDINTDVNVYVTYESPFWRVRLGNCLNREDAIGYRQYVIEKFPDFAAETYIVPSEIITN